MLLDWSKQFFFLCERKPVSKLQLCVLCCGAALITLTPQFVYFPVRPYIYHIKDVANCSVIQFGKFCQYCKKSQKVLISQESGVFILNYYQRRALFVFCSVSAEGVKVAPGQLCSQCEDTWFNLGLREMSSPMMLCSNCVDQQRVWVPCDIKYRTELGS